MRIGDHCSAPNVELSMELLDRLTVLMRQVQVCRSTMRWR